MKKPLVLHIETATSVCSVAISSHPQVLSHRESAESRSHATLLTRFIRECLEEAGLELRQLDAIHVSKGPGSYTGLRIGVSTVKGIAYASGLPVIASGTLAILTRAAMESEEVQKLLNEKGAEILLCPMIDARRMEVFTAIYRIDGSPLREVSAEIIEENSFNELLDTYRIIFFGDGSDKCRNVISHKHAHFIDGIYPSAKQMASLAREAFEKKIFENVAYFEPFYLKDFIATVPRKKVL